MADYNGNKVEHRQIVDLLMAEVFRMADVLEQYTSELHGMTRSNQNHTILFHFHRASLK